jgi:hypothetical protein
VLATQSLIESESDLKTLRRSSPRKFRVEANDMGAVRLLARGRGPQLGRRPDPQHLQPPPSNLIASGAGRWVVPPEMSRGRTGRDLRGGLVHPSRPRSYAYGRLPLAFSARCFTARHFNLQKDACEFRCLSIMDGLPLLTREGEPFLTLNGVQTQSARVHNLLADLPGLAGRAELLRISPQGAHTLEIISSFAPPWRDD